MKLCLPSWVSRLERETLRQPCFALCMEKAPYLAFYFELLQYWCIMIGVLQCWFLASIAAPPGRIRISLS